MQSLGAAMLTLGSFPYRVSNFFATWVETVFGHSSESVGLDIKWMTTDCLRIIKILSPMLVADMESTPFFVEPGMQPLISRNTTQLALLLKKKVIIKKLNFLPQKSLTSQIEDVLGHMPEKEGL